MLKKSKVNLKWYNKLKLVVQFYQFKLCLKNAVCFWAKTSRHRPYGPLKPLPIPGKKSLSTLLWNSQNTIYFDSILLGVDSFSKMAHFIPCNEYITIEQTAALSIANVFRLHVSWIIISDRGAQWSNPNVHFSQWLYYLGTEMSMNG